jgi:hypothetical protein
MKTVTLPRVACYDFAELAKLHCRAARPSVTLYAFVRDFYGIGPTFYKDLVKGLRVPNSRLLANCNNAHHRLFPGEPVMVEIPNHLPVLLGIHPPTNLK